MLKIELDYFKKPVDFKLLDLGTIFEIENEPNLYMKVDINGVSKGILNLDDGTIEPVDGDTFEIKSSSNHICYPVLNSRLYVKL